MGYFWYRLWYETLLYFILPFSLNIEDSKERQELVLQSTVQKKIVSTKRKRNETLSF